ncbi:MAG TPA: hypothetical protein VH280_10915 [Verrucomicrobiae bacterium]|jgi:hypothetical protein|nr:hypothetical protein [Verrucomicrobiae bacterium]
MKNKEIIDYVYKSIELLKGEPRPLQHGANERAFAHRLAVHLEKYFSGWDIDCEYNKHGTMPKKLEGIKECDYQRATERIYPDIIVHKRKNDSPREENLLVIELKKDNECDPCDKMKLELLTRKLGEYRYQLGLYIDIRGGEFVKTWYSNGSKKEEDFLIAI